MKSFLTFAEALKGKQHKLDADKDGKIEGEDLAKLRAMKKEEVETVEEKMDLAKASMGDVIKDFRKSDAPQFAGKSVEKRREMAIAAKLSADRGVREEVDPTHKKILNKAKTSVPKAPKSEYERKVVSYLKKKYSEEVETTNESSAYGRISSRFKTLSGRSLDAAAKEHGDEAKKLQKEIEAQQKEIDRRKAAMKEEVKPMKPPFNAPYKKAAGDVKDKSGAVHTAASRAKHLAKTGMKTQTPVKEGVFGALAGGILGGLAGGPLGLAAGAYLGHKAQQAGNNAKEVNKKLKKEEVEQIDELSFNTLASYASKVDQKDKQPLSKKRQAGYNSAAERMSQKAQTADLKKWGKISDSVEHNFDNEGNLMPNPVSFKEFISQLDEIKMADLPSRKVTGRGYGTEYYKKEAEKDKSGYDDEKKEKSEVKRGRGRPVGSASGARQKGSSTGKKRSGVEMTGYPLHLPNKN